MILSLLLLPFGFASQVWANSYQSVESSRNAAEAQTTEPEYDGNFGNENAAPTDSQEVARAENTGFGQEGLENDSLQHGVATYCIWTRVWDGYHWVPHRICQRY